MRSFWTWGWASLFVCTVLARASAGAQDRWLAQDKGLHFGASALLAGAGYAASTLLVDEPWRRAALGGGFALTLGVAKEIYDATGRGDPSLRDLTWDVIGCVFAAGVSMLLDHALRAERPAAPAPLGIPPPLQAAAW